MDAKLNHSDLSSLLAKQAKISGTKAENFTRAFFDIIIEGLEKDGIVKISGLGTFKVADVASRGSVNVNTGEKIEIKEHKKLTFIPTDTLKDKINQPFAMFEPVEIDDTYVDDEDVTEGSSATATAEEAVIAEPDTIAKKIDDTVNTENEVESVIVENDINNAVPADATEEKAAQERKEDEQIKDVQEGEKCEPLKNTYPLTETAEVPVAKSKKRRPYILYILLMVILVALLAISIPAIMVVFTGEKGAVSVKKGLSVEAEKSAVVPETAKALTEPIAPEPKEEPYEFKMVEELANKRVGAIGIGDTLLYVANSSIATHVVVENETLTRIALKYYGDKKLWPYIVQYNRLKDPNGLCKGMELEIPRLTPAE